MQSSIRVVGICGVRDFSWINERWLVGNIVTAFQPDSKGQKKA